MKHKPNLLDYVGKTVNVMPTDSDDFHEFTGVVVGIRDDLLEVQDLEDDVYCVSSGQVTPVLAGGF